MNQDQPKPYVGKRRKTAPRRVSTDTQPDLVPDDFIGKVRQTIFPPHGGWPDDWTREGAPTRVFERRRDA